MPKAKKTDTHQTDEHGYTPENYQPLPNEEAIVSFNDKTLLTSESYLDVKAYQHALAFTVAGMMDEDLLADTREAIKEALTDGTDFRTFKQRLKPFLISKGWLTETLDNGEQRLVVGSNQRLKTIFSTNLQTSYAAGQWDRIQQTKEFLPYLQYMPSVSENPRLSHKRYYGICRPVSDQIWQSIMPPNGYRCKCWVKQLTKRQAQKAGISNEQPLDTESYTNPKTGEKSDVPVGIDPSFNHNFDRLTALLRLAEDKHGKLFADKLGVDVNKVLIEQMIANSGIATVGFTGIVARQAEITRLSKELGNQKPSISEGVVGDEWQQYYDVDLERYNPKIHKVLIEGKSADFAVIDSQRVPKEWTTIDFMLTVEPHEIEGMNQYFMDTRPKMQRKTWKELENQIIDHIAKTDIVPLDLRNFYPENRTKLLEILLSLSPEQQKKIVLIED